VKGVKRLKANKPERKFLTNEEINRLCAASPSVGFVAYIKFLQYTGAREAEALRVKWSDVDFQNRRVCIGSDGLSKNGKSRCVDFSEALRAHLESWHRPEIPGYLFPSTTRAMRSELERARQKAGLPSVGFHDLRRHFVSQCVMCGIDFATIAKWIGHSDGGALLARKYAFLADGFTSKQALRVNF
jgi:integrase